MSSTTPQSDYRKPSITLRCSLRNSRIAAILPGGACEALRYDDNEYARLLTCSKSVLHQTTVVGRSPASAWSSRPSSLNQ